MICCFFSMGTYRLGVAVEDSVNGVFMASFKMGAFYGMWTWLLHSVFNTNMVYIPTGKFFTYLLLTFRKITFKLNGCYLYCEESGEDSTEREIEIEDKSLFE